MAGGRRRRGRPTRFDPEIAQALIDLVIDDDVPIVHAARRMGLGVRTVYDWLQRAEGEGAAPELAEWAGRFTQFLARYRQDNRRERSLRDREAARLLWQRFKAARERWWLDRLGPERFWSRRLSWLIGRGYLVAYARTVARLRAEGPRVTRG